MENNLILESNNINRNNPFHKNKNNSNNNNENKFIIQKIITNLFSSNKKKSKEEKNIKNKNINQYNKHLINDSFNNNKKKNNESKNFNNNYFNKEKKYSEKNKETPRLKSSNCNNKKKISGLFSANPKEKSSKLITEIDNSKQKKMGDNYSKRNLSINIHSYKGNDYKFKTSVDLNMKMKKNNNNDIDDKNMPKINLNQVFNLKLYDKNKSNDEQNNKPDNFISLNNISIGEKNKENLKNINNISSSKSKEIYYENNNNNLNDNMKKKSNTFFIKTRIDEYDLQSKNHNDKRSTKFSPKNIYIKGIKKSNIQRFFSYTKNKTNLNNNIQFMNNIKKINFNDTKKSPSKNSTRRNIISNDSSKKQNKKSEIIFLDNKRISKNRHNNISNSTKKQKENIGESFVKIRKRKPRYSDINRIIEINNLKCMKYIINSEINNVKKFNINFSTNEANEFKSNNKFNNNHKRNNHSASHYSINNNNGKYIISKIGNIFKPRLENNIRNSFNEPNNKNRNKINYNLMSLIDNKTREQKIQEKNIKHKNRFLGIYESDKKINEYNEKVNLDLNKINMELDENKTKENILNNTLTMYSIYIISKYYNTCDKIGIAKISIYDKDKNIIPIEYSITNDGQNVNYLFNINTEFSLQNDIFNDSGNMPFITKFENNFCINFYIKNIYVSNLEIFDINNYSDINNGISPIKEIKIFQTDILLYKGTLEIKNQNLIKINKKYNENVIINIDDLEKKQKKVLLKENRKSLTYTIFKSIINENSDFTDNVLKLNRYNSARNNFKENSNNSSENNNTKIINNNNYDMNNNNNINIKSKSFVQNSDLVYNKENENSENLIFFKTSQENNNMSNDISLFSNKYKDLSNTNISNLNLYTSEILDNEKEIIFSKTLKNPNHSPKLFLNSYNSASDDCNNLFRTSVGYVGFPEFTNFSQPNAQFPPNYIELNKISIYLKSNYGHKKYIGLTGIIFLDENNEQIDIEKAKAIGALPKDLRTIYNDDSDNRIFENIFNGIYNTNDSDNMWVTRIKKNEIPYFELFFEEKIKLAKIIIYNYNQKDRLEIGTKEIDIYIDNYFYHKFNLFQGTGEVAYINPENKTKLKNDFGQEICLSYEYINKNNIDTNDINISKEINFEDLSEIKFASNLFEQCYETPYLPCGNNIKIQFMSYYSNNNENSENNRINDYYIGIKNIQIFNQEGKNILNKDTNEEYEKIKYKIVSNREMEYNEEKENDNNAILLKGVYNEDENGNILYDDENYLFFIFETHIQIGYIKFLPLDSLKSKEVKNNNCYFQAKEIKIFCDDKIIYEGFVYNDKPTIILFSSDDKITQNINQDYLTKIFNERKYEEIETNNYNSLILN